MKYTCTSLHLLCLLLALMFAVSLAQDSSKYRIKGDYLDVPVRSGYRIVGDDKDGFLEDGIIVKTKGTGYIDPRYRNRRFENQPVPQASNQKYFYAPQPVASSLMYPKYAVPEIIYGRREW